MASLTYTALENSEIRLLTLLPASSNNGDLVCCSLKVVSLDDQPEYEALSYVWGDRNKTTTIMVNGVPFQATINLEAALRRLQRPDVQRVLWVDAICINQQDRLERNVQVPLMSRIYKGASLVVIWLGQGDPNIVQFFFFANASTMSHSSFSAWIDQFPRCDTVPKSAVDNSRRRIRALRGIFNLWSLPYWNRMWTFQEVYLARDDPLCLYGDLTLQLETILNALSCLNEGVKIINECHEWKDGLQPDDVTDIKGTFDLEQFADRWASMKTAQNYCKETEALIGKLVMVTRRRECLEPHDRIYALYGCAPRVQEMYPVDYSKSMAQICLETTSYIVNVESDCASHQRFNLLPSRLEGISHPSWVLDFHNAHSSSDIWVHRALAPPLCVVGEGDPWAVSTDLTTMHMRARDFGPCKVILRLATEPIEIIRQVLALHRSTEQLRTSLAPTYDGIRNMETLYQRIFGIIAAHFRIRNRRSREIQDAFNEIAQASVSESDVVYSACARKVLRQLARLAGKVFFMTEHDCLGFGNSGIQNDDVVTLPPALWKPLIIRKEANPSGGTVQQHYQMVGIAFVDGICDGEDDNGKGVFSDPDLIREVEQLEVETFLIH